ncbi:MAG: hypothetical protein K6G06_02670 [Butyrivibrio sp.]|nr:hypothetical protein [Butyrivibrio sp.]
MFKKVLGVMLALSLAITGGTFAGAEKLTVEAAAPKNFDSPATNISIATAEEIGNNAFKEGSLSSKDLYGERWYKFTNPYATEAVAEVTFSQTGGDVWPGYAFYSKNGKAIEGLDYSGYFTGSGLTVNVGLEAGETKYIRIDKKDWNVAWMTSLTINAGDESNSFNTAKKAKTYKAGKRIYGKLDYAGDVDIFKIKANKTGKMTIKVSNNDVGDDLFSKLDFTVYNKSRVAKGTETLKKTVTGKKSIKVKKGQIVYVKINMHGVQKQSRCGEYSIKTKIKR